MKNSLTLLSLFVLTACTGLSPVYADTNVNAMRPADVARYGVFKVDTVATAEEGGSRYNLKELKSTDLGIAVFGSDDLGAGLSVKPSGYYLDSDGDPNGAFDRVGAYRLVHDASLTDNGGSIIAADYSFDSDSSANDAFWVLSDGRFVTARIFGAKGDGVSDDSQALQAAIDSFGGMGGTVLIDAEIDIEDATVTVKQGVILQGLTSRTGSVSNYDSRILIDEGKISFGTYDTGRAATLKDLAIYKNSTSGICIDNSELSSGNSAYNCTIDHCYITGGQYTIKVDGAVGFSIINNSQIMNNSGSDNDLYAIHCDGTAFINGMSISDSYLAGRCWFDGSNGQGIKALSIKGIQYDGRWDPAFFFDDCPALTFEGAYLETDSTGSGGNIRTIQISDSVFGGMRFSGIDFVTPGTSARPFVCDGRAVTLENCYFRNITSTNVLIELTSNSIDCVIGANADAGGTTSLPRVTDSGARNHVYPQGKVIARSTAEVSTVGTGTEVLAAIQIPNDVLMSNGIVKVFAYGTTTSTVAANKVGSLAWGGNVFNFYPGSTGGSKEWITEFTIMQNGSPSSQRVVWETSYEGTPTTDSKVFGDIGTGTQDNANPINIHIRGQSDSASDAFILKGYKVSIE